MNKGKRMISSFLICSLCFVFLLGCEKAEVLDSQYTTVNTETPTTQETVLPSETNTQMQSVEEKIFYIRGLINPFDFTYKEDSIKNDFVVISKNGETANLNFFTKFYTDYKNGIDGSVIIVSYVNDKPAGRCAILFEAGQLECELIKKGEVVFYNLSDIYSEDNGIYGVIKNGESVLLAEGFTAPEEEPVPAELTQKLGWAFDAESGQVSWYIANTIYEMNGDKKSTLSREKNAEILNLLLSEEVYYFNDVSQQTAETTLDVRITIKSAQNDMYIMPNTDGSILIGIDGIRYVSFSQALFNKMLSLINMEVFDISSIDGVDSVSICYLDSEKNVQNKQINDAETIGILVQRLKAGSAGLSRGGFKPSAQIILHTENGDIACSLYLESMPEEPDGEIVINDFYWYDSQEAVDYIRALFD